MQRSPVGTTVLATLIAAFILFPVYWMVVTSLLPTDIVLSRDPPLLPPLSAISLQAYADVFERKPLLTWLVNTLFVTLGSVAVALVISTLAGYSLSRFRTRGQQTAGFVLLLSKMLPPTLIVIPFFIMFTSFGLIDSLFGLMLANAAVGVPFASWLMKGFFDGIPYELEQAAMIDGCSELGAMRRIAVPLCRPGIAASAVYLGIVAWADFVFARTLVSQPANWVLTVGLQSFVGEHSVDWAMLMAAGSLSLIPVVILFLLLEPFLVSGMTHGAVAN
ncbi:MAG: carbohydrate ABC transporter permease [Alphaproteobacteria bacterium]|nr:carbohydrate ABC transporter permease [Alphaproteobacteria bacterium]